jgi:hypothetical protein
LHIGIAFNGGDNLCSFSFMLSYRYHITTFLKIIHIRNPYVVFWVVTLCSTVGGYRSLGGTEAIVVRMWPGGMEGCDRELQETERS